MTGAPSDLVLDTTCLSHFARIDRLDVFGDLLSPRRCWTTTAVRAELCHGSKIHPELAGALDLPWLTLVPSDEWAHLVSFGKWAQRIGTTERNVGEATVFAAAEVLPAIAIVDDRSATQVARNHSLEVHGTLWLLAKACDAGDLTETAARNLVDMLRGSGMRLPCSGADFPAFARKHGIL
ncbi:MAG: hypothetical protein ABIQ18_28955 [Umezawaea sp.]